MLKKYFDSALNIFLNEKNIITKYIKIANREVQLHFSSEGLVDQFLPSVEHLKSIKTKSHVLTIYVGDNDSLSKNLKAPPWIDDIFNSQGFANDIDQEDYQIFFQPWIRQVYLYSRQLKTAIYWVKTESEIPWWEKTFSFRIIFHWWTRDLPAQLMHAGAIALNEEIGFLITGPSGSGKSTTCLGLVRNGYKYLGDDYIWLELSEPHKIIALYQTAKIEADNLHERFSSWKPHMKNQETYKQQKAVFDLKEMFPNNWQSSANLKGILLPQVTGNNGSSIFKSKQMSSLMAIAPTTLHHLPHHRDYSFKKISDIVLKTNTFSWNLSTIEKENIKEFKRFIENGTGFN